MRLHERGTRPAILAGIRERENRTARYVSAESHVKDRTLENHKDAAPDHTSVFPFSVVEIWELSEPEKDSSCLVALAMRAQCNGERDCRNARGTRGDAGSQIGVYVNAV